MEGRDIHIMPFYTKFYIDIFISTLYKIVKCLLPNMY